MPEAYLLQYTLVMCALCILESLFLPKYILILDFKNLNKINSRASLHKNKKNQKRLHNCTPPCAEALLEAYNRS